jgi:hypothetical protein
MTPQPPDATWKRIHANQERNSRMIFDAGLRPESIGPATCPSCGTHENALYWTVTRKWGRTLYLRCPVCEQGQARYKLDRNRSTHRVVTRAAITAGLLLAAMIGGLYHFRDSAVIQLVVEEVYEASAAVGGNTGRPSVYSGAGTSLEGVTGLVFVAAGDRRADLDRYASWIIQRDGEEQLRTLRAARYDPQRAETRVIVDPASTAWPRRLHRLRGWRQIP